MMVSKNEDKERLPEKVVRKKKLKESSKQISTESA